MKTKLLKRLHKRYDWYFNNEGYPVLIDKWFKNVKAYTEEYCLGRKIVDKEKIKCGMEEYALRVLKVDILKGYDWSPDRNNYKKATKIYKRILNESSKKHTT